MRFSLEQGWLSFLSVSRGYNRWAERATLIQDVDYGRERRTVKHKVLRKSKNRVVQIEFRLERRRSVVACARAASRDTIDLPRSDHVRARRRTCPAEAITSGRAGGAARGSPRRACRRRRRTACSPRGSSRWPAPCA